MLIIIISLRICCLCFLLLFFFWIRSDTVFLINKIMQLQPKSTVKYSSRDNTNHSRFLNWYFRIWLRYILRMNNWINKIIYIHLKFSVPFHCNRKPHFVFYQRCLYTICEDSSKTITTLFANQRCYSFACVPVFLYPVCRYFHDLSQLKCPTVMVQLHNVRWKRRSSFHSWKNSYKNEIMLEHWPSLM